MTEEWKPLSVRYGSAWARLRWEIKLFREELALAIAPWLRRSR